MSVALRRLTFARSDLNLIFAWHRGTRPSLENYKHLPCVSWSVPEQPVSNSFWANKQVQISPCIRLELTTEELQLSPKNTDMTQRGLSKTALANTTTILELLGASFELKAFNLKYNSCCLSVYQKSRHLSQNTSFKAFKLQTGSQGGVFLFIYSFHFLPESWESWMFECIRKVWDESGAWNSK